MLQVKNDTPLKAGLMLLPDASGVDTVFTVVKGTFSFAPRLAFAEEQVPVIPMDVHVGDPGTSSVRVPSDVSIGKPGTDVVLVGSAWAPGGRAAWQMDASVSVGPLAKSVRVFGDRVWSAGAAGASMSWVAPFERVPLIWELAFGGSDETERGPAADLRNPVGRGFRAKGGRKPVADLPLPNLEDPSAPIGSPSDAPPPACFAPVAPHWEPRRSYAGTYDEAWQRARAPYLPDDFDPRFCQVAPLGLTTARHLTGGEVVDLRGVTPGGHAQFQLPALRVSAAYRVDGATETRAAVLDTVVIEPDASRVVLAWRAALRCDKRALKVREVEISVAAADGSGV